MTPTRRTKNVVTLSLAVALATSVAIAAPAAQAGEVWRDQFAESPTEGPATKKTSVATGAFYTKAGTIYDPEGVEFVPQGINMGVYDSVDWGGLREEMLAQGTWGSGALTPERVDATKEWGFNTLRVNLLVTDGQPWGQVTKNGYESMMADTQKLVDAYTRAGVVLILEPHDVTGSDPDRITRGKDPAKDARIKSQMDRWYADAAKRWKSNPYVWLAGPNEPGIRDQAWVDHHDRVLGIIRGQGFKGVVSINSPVWGQDLGGSDGKYTHDPSMMKVLQDKAYPDGSGGTAQGNLLTEQHNYGGRCDSPKYPTADLIKRYADKVRTQSGTPLLFGEFGYDARNDRPVEAPDPTDIWGGTAWGSWTCSFDTEKKASNATLNHAKANGIGLLMWHGGHGGDGRSTKKSFHPFWADGGPGKNLSAQGSHLWDLTHEPQIDPVVGVDRTGRVSWYANMRDIRGEHSNKDSGGISRLDVRLDGAASPAATFDNNGYPYVFNSGSFPRTSHSAAGATMEFLPNGQHTLDFTVVDTAGNVTAKRKTFVVDRKTLGISGDVWEDVNGNGERDSGDNPVSGAQVRVTNADGSPVVGVDGKVVGPVTSDSWGYYDIEGLPVLASGSVYKVVTTWGPASTTSPTTQTVTGVSTPEATKTVDLAVEPKD